MNRLGRPFWPVVDALDYWVKDARLRIVDAVCGPEPETGRPAARSRSGRVGEGVAAILLRKASTDVRQSVFAFRGAIVRAILNKNKTGTLSQGAVARSVPGSTEKPWKPRSSPSPHPKGEGRMTSRKLTDTAVHLGGVEATAR